MKEGLKAALGTLIGAALIFFVIVLPATAHEIITSTGLVCDTQAQVQRYYALRREGETHPRLRVNVEAQATACVNETIAYIKGEVVDTLFIPEGRIDIVKIVVTAYYRDGSWVELRPTVQFIPYLEEEEKA